MSDTVHPSVDVSADHAPSTADTETVMMTKDGEKYAIPKDKAADAFSHGYREEKSTLGQISDINNDLNLPLKFVQGMTGGGDQLGDIAKKTGQEVLIKDGEAYVMPPEAAKQALDAGGFRKPDLVDDRDRVLVAKAEAKIDPSNEGVRGAINTGARSAREEFGKTITYGAVDPEKDLFTKQDRAANEQAEAMSPVASGGGAVAGFAGGVLVDPLAMGSAATKVGGAVERKVLGEASGKLGGALVRNAAEGAVYSAPAATRALVQGDPEKAGEAMLAGIGVGTLLGGAGHLAGTAKKAIAERAGPALKDVAEGAEQRLQRLDSIDRPPPEVPPTGGGGASDVVTPEGPPQVTPTDTSLGDTQMKVRGRDPAGWGDIKVKAPGSAWKNTNVPDHDIDRVLGELGVNKDPMHPDIKKAELERLKNGETIKVPREYGGSVELKLKPLKGDALKTRQAWEEAREHAREVEAHARQTGKEEDWSAAADAHEVASDAAQEHAGATSADKPVDESIPVGMRPRPIPSGPMEQAEAHRARAKVLRDAEKGNAVAIDERQNPAKGLTGAPKKPYEPKVDKFGVETPQAEAQRVAAEDAAHLDYKNSLNDKSRFSAEPSDKEKMVERLIGKGTNAVSHGLGHAVESVGAGIGGVVGGAPGAVVGYAGGKYIGKKVSERAQQFLDSPSSQKLMTKAVGKFASALDAIGPAIGEMAERTASTGKLASNNAIAQFLGTDPKESKVDQFKEMRDRLAKHVEDPSTRSDTIAKYAGATHDDHAEVYTQKANQALDYLQAQLPKEPARPGLFQPKDRWTPSPADMDRFERKVQIVSDPYSIIDDLKNGTLTQDHVDALKAVYPALAFELRERTLHKAGDPKGIELSKDKRAKLQLLLGQPLDSSATPEAVQMYQSFYNTKDGKPGEPANDNGSKPAKPMNLKNVAAAQPTPQEKMMAR